MRDGDLDLSSGLALANAAGSAGWSVSSSEFD